MMKNIFKIALSLLVIASVSVSCQKDAEFTKNANNSEIGVFGDQIKMCVNVAASDPININTKAVNPDGQGVQSMTFFCFDANGLFLATADGTLHPDAKDNERGQVDVEIPHNSRNIHIVCNLNMQQFDKDAFKGKSETEVMQGIEAISGLMLYWAKIAVPENVEQLYTNVTDADKRNPAECVLDWITIQTNPADELHKGVPGEGNPIHLLRNQARISISSEGAKDEKGWEGTDFIITGFAVYNSHSYGTVAPYHQEFGYPTYGSAEFGVTQWSMEDYICLPAEDDYLDDVQEVDTFTEAFIFESANTSEKPVEIIIKGINIYNGEKGEELYYKAQILDFEKGLLPVRRNHYYKFEIIGNLYNGQSTFKEAVEGPASNNIWLSVSDEVTSIQDGSFKLKVDEYIVIRRNDQVELDNKLDLGFSVTKTGSIDIDESLLKVEWFNDGQNVAEDNFIVDFDEATGKGTIHLTLKNITDENQILEGVLSVQYRQLFRKITVKVTPQFEFIPVYSSTEGIEGQSDHITLVYNIPDNIPAELFPFNVLVSTNELDVRSASGQKLSIVTVGEEGYGERFNDVIRDVIVDVNVDVNISDVGYKYIMKVTGPGEQRLYLETMQDQVLSDVKVYVTLENENFKRHHEPILLSNVQYEDYISVKNMKEYSTGGTDAIKYLLVPLKRYAPVTFDLATEKIELVPNGEELVKEVVPVGVTSAEEFLLYSKNLDHYPDNDNRLSQDFVNQFDCNFVPFNESEWGSNGRVFGFAPRADIANGKFEVYMETNSPKSAEVIFIVSNNTQSQSILGGGKYAGKQFRSATFELANYRPFRFAAQLNGEGEFVNDASSNEEDITDIQLSYLESDVALSFDITSFEAADGASVDPFGTAFEIFIDAPTLKLGSNPAIESEMVTMFYKDADGNPVTESKKKLEDLGDGRFVYRVDADRAKEASFWTDAATITDTKAVSQNGERKTINFLTASEISAGNVTISANPDQVTYFSKTFRISNKPISGLINYTDGEGNVDLPVGYSVSFYNKTTGQRIYSTVISEAGKFDLYLSNNRPVDIEKDPVIVSVQIGGNYYEAEIPCVNDLFVNNTITFTKK